MPENLEGQHGNTRSLRLGQFRNCLAVRANKRELLHAAGSVGLHEHRALGSEVTHLQAWNGGLYCYAWLRYVPGRKM